MHWLIKPLALFLAMVALLAVWAFAAPPVHAQSCQPYDVAIQNLANAGWTVHADILVADGYDVDRLLVGSLNGMAFALPVIDGCVIPVAPIPLGRIKDRGTPA